MPATHRNRLVTAISNTPGTSGALTIAAAASGYRTFEAGDNGLSFDVSIIDGTSWEIRTGCVYTHAGTSLARGTLEDSSTGAGIALTSAAVVTVTMSAGMGNYLAKQRSNGRFNAYSLAATNTTVASGWVKVTSTELNTERYDELGWYNLATARYTPQRAGVYLIGGLCMYANIVSGSKIIAAAIKNGGGTFTGPNMYILSRGYVTTVAGVGQSGFGGAALISMNGTTDYLELFTYTDSAAPMTVVSTENYNNFWGMWVSE